MKRIEITKLFPLVLIGVVLLSLTQRVVAQADSLTLLNRNRVALETMADKLDSVMTNLDMMQQDSMAIHSEEDIARMLKYYMLMNMELRLSLDSVNQALNVSHEQYLLLSKLDSLRMMQKVSYNKTVTEEGGSDAVSVIDPSENCGRDYFVVLASRRSEEACNEVAQTIQQKGYRVIVVQNATKTWFHVVLEQRFSRIMAGKVVAGMRCKYSNAWWMKS